MKKSYLMFAIAAFAMVSCAQEDLLRNNSQNEGSLEAISFKNFSEKLTRGDSKPASGDYYLEDYHTTMAVYGTKKDVNDEIQTVFDKVTCTYNESNVASGDGTGEWQYAPARFWDKQSSYKFSAFAPASAPLKFDFTDGDDEIDAVGGKFVTTSAYTLGGQNLVDGNEPDDDEINIGFDGKGGNDMDIMIADYVEREAGVTSVVDLIFNHTLSKLLVALKAGEDAPASSSDAGYTVTVSSVLVEDYLAKGTYDTDTWSADASGDAVDYSYTASGDAIELTDDAVYFIESLVMPQDIAAAQKVTIEYNIKTQDGEGHYYDEDFTYTISMDDVFSTATAYEEGAKYIVTFTIDPTQNIIKFDAGVYDWADGAENPSKTIDND